MQEDIYFKQKKLYHPEEGQPRIYIYGCGSIGSHTAIALTKMGMRRIEIMDFDKVEPDNIPAQFFNKNAIESKVRELADEIYRMTGTRVKEKEGKITEESELDIEAGTIHIVAFDNIEGRRIIYEKLKDNAVWLIDGRIGAFNWEIYCVNCLKETKKYKETMEGEFTELECGEKTLWAVNSLIASKIATDTIKIIKKKEPAYMEKGNIMNHITICRQEQE